MCKKIFSIKNGLILIFVIIALFIGYKVYKHFVFKENIINDDITERLDVEQENNSEDNNIIKEDDKEQGENNTIEENNVNTEKSDVSSNKSDNKVTSNNNNVSKPQNNSSSNKENNVSNKPNNNTSSNVNNNVNNNSNNNTSSNANNNVSSEQTNGTSTSEKENESSNKPNQNNPSEEQNNNPSSSVCTSANSGWSSYIADWKTKNPTSVIFDTKEEAVAYGNYAMNFGYGYWFDGQATTYKDNECTKSFYSARLYIPAGVCTKDGVDNKKINLPATKKENLIDKYQYLVNNGYDCTGKCTRQGVCF